MRQKVKEAVVLGLLVLFSVVLWLTLSVLLPKLSWDESALIASAITATVLLFVLWGLTAMVITDGFWVVLAWAIVSFSGLLWFWGLPFLIVSTLLFLAGVIGFFRTRGQIQKTLDGGLVRPLRCALQLAATAIAATIAVAAYQTAPQSSLDIEALVPEYLFARVLVSLEPTIRSLSPELKLDEATTHTIYVFSIDFIKKQADYYKNIFPIAYAVGFFATMRFFGIFLYWIAIMLVSFLLHILRKFGIVELRLVPRNLVTYSFS